MKFLGRKSGSALAVVLALTHVAWADTRTTVWQLLLGSSIAALPPSSTFGIIACGSDGGPPLAKLHDWEELLSCAPEADGLREVYVEYDRKAEAAAEAAHRYLDPNMIGTSEALFPIIASALFDVNGTLRAVRLVTDPRPDARGRSSLPRLRPRGEHYLLGGYLMKRFGMDASDCRSLEPDAGETPVIGQFIKRDCTKKINGTLYVVQQRYLRKRGQKDVDPESGQLTDGQFESWTRAEVRLESEVSAP
jgi:hypothetical protein